MLTYVAVLKKLAAHCNFGANLNETLQDRLVCGLHNAQMQKRLLSELYQGFEDRRDRNHRSRMMLRNCKVSFIRNNLELT